MKTAREVAHGILGVGIECWGPGPVHGPLCDQVTAAITARDSEHTASRGTGEREAGRREGLNEAVDFLRSAHPRTLAMDMEDFISCRAALTSELSTCATRIAASPIPVPDEAVRREDVVRWLEWRAGLYDDRVSSDLVLSISGRLANRSWLSDLASLNAAAKEKP